MSEEKKPNPYSITEMEEERKIMSAYSDTAKSYTQLSIGALVLSITFIEKVLNEKTISMNGFLISAWVLWLLSSLAGISYQYFAVRYLENMAEKLNLVTRTDRSRFLKIFQEYPYILYGILLFTFYFGVISFGIFGICGIVQIK